MGSGDIRVVIGSGGGGGSTGAASIGRRSIRCTSTGYGSGASTACRSCGCISAGVSTSVFTGGSSGRRAPSCRMRRCPPADANVPGSYPVRKKTFRPWDVHGTASAARNSEFFPFDYQKITSPVSRYNRIHGAGAPYCDCRRRDHRPLLRPGPGHCGLKITVLEAGEAAREASWAAGGMLAADDPENPPALLPLSRYSRSLYPVFLREIEALSGQRVPLRTHETIQVLNHDPSAPRWRAPVAEEASKLVPGLESAERSYLLLEEASLDPRELCAALRSARPGRRR